MELNVDPKVDYVFKKILGSEEQKDVLAHFINSVQPGSEPVQNLILLNPFSQKEVEEGKEIELDIAASDTTGRLFGAEMQQAAPRSYPARVVYYCARMHGGQLTAGESWNELRQTTSIHVLNSKRFDDDAYHHCFTLFDQKNKVELCNQLTIHIIELPKFNLTIEELTTPMEVWCYFLKRAESLDPDNLPEAFNIPPFIKTIKVLQAMSMNSRDRARIESSIIAARDRATELEDARDDGLDQGIEKGVLIERVQFSQELLGLAVSSRAELKALGSEALAALADHLKQQAKTRP